MANREAIYEMNDDALVHRGSTPSNIFKAGRMIGPPSWKVCPDCHNGHRHQRRKTTGGPMSRRISYPFYDKELENKSKEELIEIICKERDTHATIMQIHTGFHMGKREQYQFSLAMLACKEASSWWEEYGIDHIHKAPYFIHLIHDALHPLEEKHEFLEKTNVNR